MAFNDAIRRCVRCYFEKGPRSPSKLRPLHNFVNQCVSDLLPDYEVVSYVEDQDGGKEETVQGLFNAKKVDVAVKRRSDASIRGVVSVKFVMSNYNQNSNNYFESMLGECQNLKLLNPGLVFWYFFVVLETVPYFDKNGSVKRWEKSRKDEIVAKHDMLNRLGDKSQTPDCVSVAFVSVAETEKTEWGRHVADPGRFADACTLVEGAHAGTDWHACSERFAERIQANGISRLTV
jgi:hypothetical protein